MFNHKLKMIIKILFLVALTVSFNNCLSSAQDESRPIRLFGRFQFNFGSLTGNETDPEVELPEPNRPRIPFGAAGFSRPVPTIPPVDPPSSCLPRPRCPFQGDKFYRPDGSCNNLVEGGRGQAGRPHKRLVPADYRDGQGQPRTGRYGPLPSARLVSTAMQDSRTRKSRKNTHILVIWCQFITHDITNTPTITRGEGEEIDCRCRSKDPACFNIRVPRNDLQVIQENKFCLPVVRSQAGPPSQCNRLRGAAARRAGQVREQLNNITPYLDAGTVYGSSEFQLNELLDRTSPIGELKTGDLPPPGMSPPYAPSLPLATQVHPLLQHVACPLDVHKPVDVPCFVAGDDRANENPALASFHTLFVRMHNRLVKELKQINPRWRQQQLIDNARLIMSAVTQRITYKEFLPELLGDEYMTRFDLKVLDNGYWRGYDLSYDATTSNSFATAALRFGHTLVTSPLSRPSPSWRRHQPDGFPMSLKDHFFNTIPLLTTNQGGANSILRGLCDDAAEIADTTFVDDLHNFLFAPEGRLGHDLLAINIQRGRDHGIPGYNAFREFCGLKKARTFNDFTEIPPHRRSRLSRLYSKRVDHVDLYIAGIAENPIRGGLFGPTFSCILAYQFRDFKRGDRLWHENGGDTSVFTRAQLEAIREYKLSRLLCDDLNDMTSVQPNPFQQTGRRNQREDCRNYRRLNLQPWKDTYSSDRRRYTAPTVKTAWFPANHRGYDYTPRQLLSYLRSTQPHDVCSISLGSESRRRNGNTQYRFNCHPGSIKATDYPNVDASRGEWTDWEDASNPDRRNGYDDEETPSCAHSCVGPIAIQVFTKQGVPARRTGEVFLRFSPTTGFICRGRDQQNRRCQDYQVRYFCRSKRSFDFPAPTSPADYNRYCIFYRLCCNPA